MTKHRRKVDTQIVKPLDDKSEGLLTPGREYIAIFYKNYRHVTISGPSIHHRSIQGYCVGQVAFGNDLVERLLKNDAPVEVYWRDAD